MTQVMAPARELHEVRIDLPSLVSQERLGLVQTNGNGLPNLSNFERVSQPIAEEVRLPPGEKLHFALEPAEARAMEDPGAVAAKRRPVFLDGARCVDQACLITLVVHPLRGGHRSRDRLVAELGCGLGSLRGWLPGIGGRVLLGLGSSARVLQPTLTAGRPELLHGEVSRRSNRIVGYTHGRPPSLPSPPSAARWASR